jgi:hypothetical protein
MISRSNYETFFIDYFDGKLDKLLEKELFYFLSENPDLKEEFKLFGGVKIETDSEIIFKGKDRLKKDLITLSNYKTWLVARIENDLNESDIFETEKFIKRNADVRREFEILKLSRLIPDQRIIFDRKNALKKGRKVLTLNPVIKSTLSIAAALLTIVVAYYFIRQNNAPKKDFAGKESIEKNNPVVKSPAIAIENPVLRNPEKIIVKEKTIVNKNEKKSSLVLNENIIPATSIYKKEIPVALHKDTLFPMSEAGKSDYAGNWKAKMNAEIKNANVKSPVIKINVAKVNYESKNISEIFSDEEIADLKRLQEQRINKTHDEIKNLGDVAKNELDKLSKKADIRFQRQIDPETYSLSFTFELGKNFSVTHTSGK